MPPAERNVRIVLADDFAEWRKQVREILSVYDQWEIIAEADRGSEAVQKCAETQPDVLILDIGMPGLNGIQAAKLIRRKSPQTKIVFLSQQSDSEIMDAALQAGGSAYVLKHNAAAALANAIAAALTEFQAAIAPA